MTPDFVRVTDYDLDEPLTLEVVAEATGIRVTFIERLVHLGLLETIGGEPPPEPVLVPRRTVLRLRQIQRLRRDLGVNAAGASIILDLVERMEGMKREVAETRARFGK